MAVVQYFIDERTRLCKVLSGHVLVQEALSEGYREVTPAEQDAFRDTTRAALDAGWNPDEMGYAAFLATQKAAAQ
jgi:hypothetical protein